MSEGNVLLVTADNRPIWPFPIVNGQQTEDSKALQDNKALHKPQKPSLDDVEDALL